MVPINSDILDCEAELLLPPTYDINVSGSNNTTADPDNPPLSTASISSLIDPINEQAKLLQKAIIDAREAGLVVEVEVDHRLCRVSYRI